MIHLISFKHFISFCSCFSALLLCPSICSGHKAVFTEADWVLTVMIIVLTRKRPGVSRKCCCCHSREGTGKGGQSEVARLLAADRQHANTLMLGLSVAPPQHRDPRSVWSFVRRGGRSLMVHSEATCVEPSQMQLIGGSFAMLICCLILNPFVVLLYSCMRTSY